MYIYIYIYSYMCVCVHRLIVRKDSENSFWDTDETIKQPFLRTHSATDLSFSSTGYL